MSVVKKASLVFMFVGAVVSGQFGMLLGIASHAATSGTVAMGPAGNHSGNSCG